MKYKINIILIFLILLNLFIIFPECKEISENPWPMFKHDPQHTGRVPYPGVQKPILKWKLKTGGWIYSSPSISKDGTIYFGSHDHYLYALNPDGSLKWKFKTGEEVPSSPAIDSNGTIYFGSYDSYLYALNSDGSLKWRFRAESIIASSPAIGLDGTIYFGDLEGCFYAIGDISTQPSSIIDISLIIILIITIIIFLTILILNILKRKGIIKE
ncbi:MAG: PQQ-binding-like beta-propeller repeat protein [Nitrososphaerota archaeon]